LKNYIIIIQIYSFNLILLKKMLIIPDIHINKKMKNEIINTLKDIVKNNENEKNIIFLWDYVYHFSYDRVSLLELFNFFSDLYKEWKNIYIMSWNHDWIWEHFVYEESEKILSLINNNKIKFITKPSIEVIEDKKILFMPFNIHNYKFENETIVYKLYKNSIWQYNTLNEPFKYDWLIKSNNKKEIISWILNEMMEDILIQNEDIDTIIHHYYISWIKFDWQRDQFKFFDIAIDWNLLDKYNKIQFISWHLHKPFSYKNYFCCWSLWNSSPIEINQNKIYTIYKDNKFINYGIQINQYYFIKIDDITKIEEEIINIFNKENERLNIKQTIIDKKNINLFIESDVIEYSDIEEIVDKYHDVKIKKTSNKYNNIFISEQNELDFFNSINDWKLLFKEYLNKQYQEDEQKYLLNLFQKIDNA